MGKTLTSSSMSQDNSVGMGTPIGSPLLTMGDSFIRSDSEKKSNGSKTRHSGDSGSSSRASSVVNEDGAYSTSRATAMNANGKISTSSNGKTSTSSDSVFVPEPTSTGSRARAIATSDGVRTKVTVNISEALDFRLPDTKVTLTGSVIADRIRGTSVSELIKGNGSGDTIKGKGGDDILTGGAGDDAIAGNGGADLIKAGKNDDRARGGNGDDQMRGQDGADNLLGGKGADSILGGQGNDTLLGGSGDDVLIGGGGDDVLSGGNGKDMMMGCSGADVFKIQPETSDITRADIISDFKRAHGDMIRLPNRIRVNDVQLRAIDTDGNGQVDSTLIQLASGNIILAVVLNTVNGNGESTLTANDFI